MSILNSDQLKMRATLAIIDSKFEKQEIKLMLILDLVNSKDITMADAFSLIERAGIFTDRWPMIEFYANEILNQYTMRTKAAV